MNDSRKHIAVLLNWGYVFPNKLNHFPFSTSIYQWLTEDSRHRATIFTPTPIVITNIASDQINIHYIQLPKYFSHQLIYAAVIGMKLFCIRLKRIINKESDYRLIKLTSDKHLSNEVIFSDIPDPVFIPLSEEGKRVIKQVLSNETEYFICTANFHDIKSFVFLLKAFSLLKKRLRSGIKLMLTGIHPDSHPLLFKQIRQYKYRSDIICINDAIEYNYIELLGASYAQIFPSHDLCYPSGKWESVKMCVPVIASKKDSDRAETETSFLYFEKDSVDDLADKMMLIYKDETLRKKMILQSLQALQIKLSENTSIERLSAILINKGL